MLKEELGSLKIGLFYEDFKILKALKDLGFSLKFKRFSLKKFCRYLEKESIREYWNLAKKLEKLEKKGLIRRRIVNDWYTGKKVYLAFSEIGIKILGPEETKKTRPRGRREGEGKKEEIEKKKKELEEKIKEKIRELEERRKRRLLAEATE